MAFERLRTNQGVDTLLGKPKPAAEAPWFAASPQQNKRNSTKKKAEKVKHGQARFSADEIQKILADWVLST